MHREELLHPLAGKFRILQQARGIGEPEQFGEVQDAARALLAADHGEVILVAVEIRHEYDAGLVEARRALEDVARQRHRRAEDGVELLDIALRQFAQCGTRGRPDRIEDAQQRIALAVHGIQ